MDKGENALVVMKMWSIQMRKTTFYFMLSNLCVVLGKLKIRPDSWLQFKVLIRALAMIQRISTRKIEP